MEKELQRSPKVGSLAQKFRTQIFTLTSLTATFWGLQIVNSGLGNRLARLGILPRTESGLSGIIFAPFLHGSFAHVAANTLPFVVLGWLVMLRGMGDFIFVSVLTALSSGLGVWLISPDNSITIGASGVIFGYLGFLLGCGYFERSFRAIALSLLTSFLYGGILFGVLPGESGISWQAHLFGFLGGIWAASLLSQSASKVHK